MRKRRIYKVHHNFRGWRTSLSRANSSQVYHTSYPILVHRPALSDWPSFRPRLTTTPLACSLPSAPRINTWSGDLHPGSHMPCLAHIGIGRDLTIPLLPHHRAYGSRTNGGSVDYSGYNARCKEPAGFTHTLTHTLFTQQLSSHHPKAGLMSTRLMPAYPLIPFRPSAVTVRLGLSVSPSFEIGVPK